MSENLPAEPAEDPVARALRMRASDADREKVANILRDAYAEGRLSAVEHQERLDEAYHAQTYGDLIPVMRDLPVPPGTLAIPTPNDVSVAPSPTPAEGGIVVNPGLAGTADPSMVAIFAAFERKGQWTVPAESTATCIFGSGEVDLTEAVLTSREVVINGVCLFGSLEITVPDGILVRNEAVGIFGGVTVPEGSPPPGAPVLVVKGAAIFGSIDIKRPKAKRKWGITKS